jgi:hypothetical protein
MECPICRGDVENLTPANYKGLVVACPRCGDYRVMQRSLTSLRALKIEERLAALKKAKRLAFSRCWPTISDACF